MKKVILMTAILLTACSPQRVQTATLLSSEHGRNRYQMTGYTDLGETAPNSSARHINEGLSEVCPGGVKIIKLTESPSGNAVGDFLYWETTAECK